LFLLRVHNMFDLQFSELHTYIRLKRKVFEDWTIAVEKYKKRVNVDDVRSHQLFMSVVAILGKESLSQ